MKVAYQQSFKMEQVYTPPSDTQAPMLSLSAQQMLALLEKVVADADTIIGEYTQKREQRSGNFYPRSPVFAGLAKNVRAVVPTTNPEYAIVAGTIVQERIANVRENIVDILESWETEDGSPKDSFLRNFRHNFNWITRARLDVVQYTVNLQSEFITHPDNPLFLRKVLQRDIAEGVGFSVSTISRLLYGVRIEVPVDVPDRDAIVEDSSDLVPGIRFSAIQGKHALNQLRQNVDYFDPVTGCWKITSTDLVKILEDKYNIRLDERTVRKYWGSKKPKKPELEEPQTTESHLENEGLNLVDMSAIP